LAGRGDIAAAAELAERAEVEITGWRGAVAAAHAMFAVWQAARRQSAGTATASAVFRDRAIELQRAAIDALQPLVESAPEDLWVVAPCAEARVRLAIALQDRGAAMAARTELDAGLAVLEQVRAEVLACEWDEGLFQAAKALSAR
jgi:hypothetical protein